MKKVFPNEQLIPEVISLIEQGHTVTLPLRGFSMRPFLEDNRDKALLTKPDRLKVGDPVLAEVRPKFYVLHRIIAIDGERVVLRGDGNLACEHCLRKDIKAAVIGFYRKKHNYIDRTDGLKWRLYSRLWLFLFPVRRYLLAFYRRVWIKCFGLI